MATHQLFTFSYKKETTGSVVVRARSQEEAENEAYEFLERDDHFVGFRATEYPGEVEVELLDLKDVEPDGPDRDEA